VNWSRLDEISEYDRKGGLLVKRLVASFAREGRSQLAAIGRAARRRDVAALASAAHALKGASLNVGAAQLGELCAALEAWGREGRVDRAVPAAALLGQRFRETAKALGAGLPRQAPASRKPSGGAPLRRTGAGARRKPGSR
jgi:HPt (histidine-containing phosphotransfer) domain-containing protein